MRLLVAIVIFAGIFAAAYFTVPPYAKSDVDIMSCVPIVYPTTEYRFMCKGNP